MRNRLSPSVWRSTRRDHQTWFCLIRNLWTGGGAHVRLASLPAEARTSPPARPHIDARRRHRIVRPLRRLQKTRAGGRQGRGRADERTEAA